MTKSTYYVDLTAAILVADSHLNDLENAIDASAEEILPLSRERGDEEGFTKKARHVFEVAADAHADLCGLQARRFHAAEQQVGDLKATKEDCERIKQALTKADTKLNRLRHEYGLPGLAIGPQPDALDAWAPAVPTRLPETAAERRRMEDHVSITREANRVGRKQIAELVLDGWQNAHKQPTIALLNEGVIGDHIQRLEARSCEETTVETFNEALGELAELVKNVPAELPEDVIQRGRGRTAPAMDF